jgi:hypothetical protein
MAQASPDTTRARKSSPPRHFTTRLSSDLALDCVMAIAAAAGFGCGPVLAISLLAGGL